MELKQWLNQRALLNHDILCNQLRNELVSLRAEPTRTKIQRLSTWPKRKTEYMDFLNNTIDVLSFASLLDTDVFGCWSYSKKNSFKPAFHELFLNTTTILNKVTQLKRLVDLSVNSVLNFINTEPQKRTVQMIIDLQEKLETLSNGISSLPNNMKELV